MFLEYSSRDLHFSTKQTDAKDVYKKLDTSASPRYLELALSDTFLLDWFMEFFDRKKEINVIELMQLFPDFDKITPLATTKYLDMLLPDVVEKYGNAA